VVHNRIVLGATFAKNRLPMIAQSHIPEVDKNVLIPIHRYQTIQHDPTQRGMHMQHLRKQGERLEMGREYFSPFLKIRKKQKVKQDQA
jgi:hypothetical protein